MRGGFVDGPGTTSKCSWRKHMSVTTSLHGIRVWLSGAVPEADGTNEQERKAIEAFVELFASAVFRLGGHIIHGAHPTFTPILLAKAIEHQRHGGKKDCLTLVVSRHWSKDPRKTGIDDWRNDCTTYETPEATGDNARDDSLRILREWMAARSDAFVAVGGKWWQQVAGRAGVPIEASLAVARGIPCFLAGGLAGAARDYVRDHPELLRSLKNGLDEDSNRAIATNSDVSSLADTICNQLGRLPIIRGRTADGPSFRILALDGGGIKGTFTAAALATWENQLGVPILGHFDLIAGTSTGGILAIGLGIGLRAADMLKFYKMRGPEIFPITSLGRRFWHSVRHLFHPKYSQSVLLRELQAAYYGEGPPVFLRNAKSRLVIPAYHAVAGSTHIFRTPHHELLTADADVDAAHAALATAAAPTFFAAAKVGNMVTESKYFDGGVWANSPAMAAIVEAVCYLGVPLDRIDVLSVGTTEEPFSARKKVQAGIGKWGPALIDLLMNAQAESSIRHARLLAGEPRFLRVNAMTRPGTYSLDSPNDIDELASLGNTEAAKPEILGQIRSRFLNGVAVESWQSSSTNAAKAA